MNSIETFISHPCFVALKRPRDDYDGRATAWEANFVGLDPQGHKAFLYSWGETAEAACVAAMARLGAGEVRPWGNSADSIGISEVARWHNQPLPQRLPREKT